MCVGARMHARLNSCEILNLIAEFIKRHQFLKASLKLLYLKLRPSYRFGGGVKLLFYLSPSALDIKDFFEMLCYFITLAKCIFQWIIILLLVRIGRTKS